MYKCSKTWRFSLGFMLIPSAPDVTIHSTSSPVPAIASARCLPSDLPDASISGGFCMFRLDLGSTGRYCDGMNRRSFLQLGVAGMAGIGLPELLLARADSPAPAGGTRNTSVILIWLDGGPSHLDMYDMKPDAPAEYRGIWRPIRTRVPGFDITEMFPKQARVTDKFSMVRSLHHNT